MNEPQGAFELIDKLCEVTTQLADLVRKQAAIIMQSDIPEETKKELETERKPIEDKLDLLEYKMRRI